MSVQVKPWKVFQILFLIAIILNLAYFAGQIVEMQLGLTLENSLFDLKQAHVILKLYSTSMLLLCSTLLFTITVSPKEGDIFYWLSLSLIFLCLAFAKNIPIHEIVAFYIRSNFNISKLQFYAWAYGVVLVIFPVLYLKFFLRLPRRTMSILIFGGLTFLVGAFGFDLVVARIGQLIDHHTVAYISLSALEEMLEVSGIVIMAYGLLLYISSESKWTEVRIFK